MGPGGPIQESEANTSGELEAERESATGKKSRRRSGDGHDRKLLSGGHKSGGQGPGASSVTIPERERGQSGLVYDGLVAGGSVRAAPGRKDLSGADSKVTSGSPAHTAFLMRPPALAADFKP